MVIFYFYKKPFSLEPSNKSKNTTLSGFCERRKSFRNSERERCTNYDSWALIASAQISAYFCAQKFAFFLILRHELPEKCRNGKLLVMHKVFVSYQKYSSRILKWAQSRAAFNARWARAGWQIIFLSAKKSEQTK